MLIEDDNESDMGATRDKPIELEEVKIDVSDNNLVGGSDSKLDVSMNSVIKVGGENDAASSLDTSIVSVIKAGEDDSKGASKGDAGDGAESEDNNEANKDEEDDITLNLAQFEVLLSDLKTKHCAEKRML